ncbi:MAG: putative ABC transporter permease [Lachnospiraceae bacterium]|nr:putative ABC transporter permease [Lachnospiraceae bacterium]
MTYTGYDLLWLFFLYSFAGWVLETVFAVVKQKNLVNRGLINGPVCITYGVGATLITVGLSELEGVWLFLGATIYATVIEWIAGHMIEKAFHERWWDYSKRKWNLDGYICAASSIVWGALGYIVVTWANYFSLNLFHLIPGLLGKPLIWVMLGILAVDNLASYMLLKGRSGRLDQWEAANNQIANVSARLGKWIAGHVERRIHRAYPQAQKLEVIPKTKTVFAEGCDFYKVMVLFFIGAFLGDIIETIFCRFSMGYWMSRSSVVWGSFSIIWGIAIAAATAMLYKYKDRESWFLFWMGTMLGGGYEYLCSVFTEIVFGKIFWDYSGIPFNLGGRINLLFCFFWGIAAVVWFKKIYPKVSSLIEKIPILFGKITTWCLIIFMCANMLVSCMALIRSEERTKNLAATASWQVWMDEHYDDTRLNRIYPNAKKANKIEQAAEQKAQEAKR